MFYPSKFFSLLQSLPLSVGTFQMDYLIVPILRILTKSKFLLVCGQYYEDSLLFFYNN